MPVPDPSPDAGRCDWLGRCLFSVTIGGAVTVLVSAAAAILRTPTIGRAVIAPLFEIALTIGPTALRRCRGSTADESAKRRLQISQMASWVCPISWRGPFKRPR